MANELGGKAYYVDVSNSKNVEETFSKIKAEFNRLDILVNNAGINGFENKQKHNKTTSVFVFHCTDFNFLENNYKPNKNRKTYQRPSKRGE